MTGLDDLYDLDPLEVLGFRRPPWFADANCLEHPTVNFFVAHGESVEPARAVCSRCLVAGECLEWALTNHITDGIFGGLSPRARQRLRASATTSLPASTALTGPPAQSTVDSVNPPRHEGEGRPAGRDPSTNNHMETP